MATKRSPGNAEVHQTLESKLRGEREVSRKRLSMCRSHQYLSNFVVIHGTVAQWLERKPDKLEVDGSIPSRPTKKQMPQRITSQSSGLRECESHPQHHMLRSSSSLGHLKLIFSLFVVSLIWRAIKALPSNFILKKPGLLLSRLLIRY